ncbi:hypothetical protein B0H14DRAFT_3880260 [Mycena olivaceomarginata]|nr:hypothetical protein B0H14DRAFT_3880260 [Mycena olivaceomarginata]
MHQEQDYIAEGDFQPGGSPDNEFRIQLDPHDDDPRRRLLQRPGQPAFPHTPSYNGSYHNSPYSNHSELSFSGDPTQDSFALFDDEPGQQQGRDGYDPAEYDAPQAGGGLLMFNDSDYMSGPGPYVSSVPVGPAPDRHHTRGSYDYSSPNSSDGGEEQQVHQQRHQSRSRASSIASNHHQQPQSSPRMNPLPLPRSPRATSPHMQQQQKPQSPPRLLMPDDNSGPSNFDPPTINAPEGDGLGAGPRLHIVPATPVSGGGAAGGAGVPGFQETLHQVTEQQDEYRAEQQQLNSYDPPAPAQPGGHRRTGSNASVHSNSNSPFLFPSNMLPGPARARAARRTTRSSRRTTSSGRWATSAARSTTAWATSSSRRRGSIDDTTRAGGASARARTGARSAARAAGGYAPAPGSAGLDNGFLSPDLGMGFGGFGGGGLGLGLGPGGGGAVGLRRVKSDAAARGHVRQSRSEDIRGTGAAGTMFPSEDFMRGGGGHGQFLSPVEPPPAIRSGGQGQGRAGVPPPERERRWSAASSTRVSPYPSPNVSPSPHYTDLPDPNAPFGPNASSSFGPSFNNDGNSPPIVVSKQNVTTLRTSKASHNRRKQEATFARQHDCKRHEQLHTNYRPFVCGGGESGAGGCGKMFARMDALNRHLRSEGGAECQRTLEANGRLPDFSGGGLMPEAGGGRARSYSTGSTGGEGPPQLRMGGGGMGVPKTEDPAATGLASPPSVAVDPPPPRHLTSTLPPPKTEYGRRALTTLSVPPLRPSPQLVSLSIPLVSTSPPSIDPSLCSRPLLLCYVIHISRLPVLHRSLLAPVDLPFPRMPTTSTTTPLKRMNQTPFTIQELVDRCIHFLRVSQRDLKACALVSRSWLYPAQSQIFREIIITAGNVVFSLTQSGHPKPARWSRLQQTLETSPHLIQHIRDLSIRIGAKPNEELLSICNFPFTHLEHVGSHCGEDFTAQIALAFQQLFSLPTIRSIELGGMKPTDFAKTFERCSSAVTKLEVRVNGGLSFSRHTRKSHRNTNRTRLVNIRDTSNLKALRLTSMLGITWNDVVLGIKTVEILSMVVQNGLPRNVHFSQPVKTIATNLDLSALPRLSVLHINKGAFDDPTVEAQMINALISTIPSQHQMHSIVLTLPTAIPAVWEALDLTLSRLRVSVVEIHVFLHREEALLCFPRLSAKNILRVDYNPYWWEDITAGL